MSYISDIAYGAFQSSIFGSFFKEPENYDCVEPFPDRVLFDHVERALFRSKNHWRVRHFDIRFKPSFDDNSEYIDYVFNNGSYSLKHRFRIGCAAEELPHYVKHFEWNGDPDDPDRTKREEEERLAQNRAVTEQLRREGFLNEDRFPVKW